MIDPIVEKGAKVLGEHAHEVPKDFFGTKKLATLIARMSASLRTTEHGVAIAAPQIGLSYRIFVVRGCIMAGQEGLPKAERDDTIPDVVFINPKMAKISRKKELLEEACLSVPGYYGFIKRSVQATVRAYDKDGKRFERGGSGLLAQIFQHETDHLEGILYVDKAEEVHETKKEEEDGVKKDEQNS